MLESSVAAATAARIVSWHPQRISLKRGYAFAESAEHYLGTPTLPSESETNVSLSYFAKCPTLEL